MKLFIVLVTALAITMPLASPAFAHCEIPCGIYDDEMRIAMIAEHITTIEKSMTQIEELSKEEPLNYNQIIRWVQNKEEHANKLQHVVTEYFMTQRLKPADMKDKDAYTAYTQQLTQLHQMLYYAMKAKQTTDKSNVEKLRSLLNEFKTAYFGTHEH